MIRRFNDAGFSALELLMVVALVGSLAAIGVPLSGNFIEDVRLRGDAQGVSGAVALTKMTAAAKFTRARLRVDSATGTYRIETWQRTAPVGWVAEGGDVRLSSRDQFGAGPVIAPPPDSQAVIGQPPACLDNDDTAIEGTSCVLFNSRGIPVSAAGAPVTTQVVYLRGPVGVFAVVVGATGRQQVWRTTLTSAGTWKQQ
jgi:prepilin-type N-terminal cleavage/methylation domain-containing protein